MRRKRQQQVMLISMGLNLVLLIAVIGLIAGLVYTSRKNGKIQTELDLAASRAEAASATLGEDGAEVMGAGEEETASDLEDWIGNMKDLAQRHQVDAYFLQELFPDKIVYNFRGDIIYADVNPDWPKHDYNWSFLEKGEGNSLHYNDPNGYQGIFGIDVSKYQGDIDWGKVKDEGVEFVILRAGYRGYETGDLVVDEYFDSYLKGATEAGIPVGVYFFSQAVTAEEAAEEAQFIIDAIGDYEVSYPLVFDMEEVEVSPYRTEDMTAAEITDVAIAFCDAVEAGGYTPMLYGNVSWFLSRFEMDRLDPYDKWFAQYRSMPFFPYDFQMWQYTHRGRVDGIEGDVDMNISFVDYSAQ